VEGVVRAKRRLHLPVVLTREEVRTVLRQLQGVKWMMASLLYGAGLRLLECCRLRVKDVDLDKRDRRSRWEGGKDRVTLLPVRVVEPVRAHLGVVRRQHEADLASGAGSVELPWAIERKYPRAPWKWGWQWIFPATRFYVHPATGRKRRHHLHESVLQKAVRESVLRAGIAKPATCLTPSPVCDTSAGRRLRHSDHPGVTWSQRCEHDDGLHACSEPRWPWCS